MKASGAAHKIPDSAQRFDIEPSASHVREMFLFYSLMPCWSFGLPLWLVYAELCRLQGFPVWAGVFCLVLPPLGYSLLLLNILRRRSPGKHMRLFVDSAGVYVLDTSGAVTVYKWEHLSGFRSVAMSGRNSVMAGGNSQGFGGFNLMVLMWPPSFGLIFGQGKEVEVYNVFYPQKLLNVNLLMRQLYMMARGNKCLEEKILANFPTYEEMVLNWSSELSQESSNCGALRAEFSESYPDGRPRRLDIAHGRGRRIGVLASYVTTYGIYCIAVLTFLSWLLPFETVGVWLLLAGCISIYPIWLISGLLKVYFVWGPQKVAIFVDGERIWARRADGGVDEYDLADLVEFRTRAVWRGPRDILSVVLFLPPSVSVVFRDNRVLPIYNVFNGVECMAVSSISFVLTVFSRFYRMSGKNEKVLDSILKIYPEFLVTFDTK